VVDRASNTIGARQAPRNIMRLSSMAIGASLAGVLLACSGAAQLPVTAGMGPTPALPAPQRSLIPTVHIAEAIGWPADARRVAADGLAVNRFADGLAHPAVGLRDCQR